MFDFIDTLRAKPEHVKNRFAVIFAFVVTGFIFVIWLITFTYSGNKEKSATAGGESGPFKDLKTTFSHFLDQMSPEEATTSSLVE
jgi:hypothetical protein